MITFEPRTILLSLHTEHCVWLVPVIAPYPQCTYQQSDCQSIVCTTYYGYIEKVTLSLDNICADPLSVELTAETCEGNSWFQETFTTDSSQFDYGFLTMQRSDTQLNFSVSTLAVEFTKHVQLNIYEHTMYVYTCMVIHACKIT